MNLSSLFTSNANTSTTASADVYAKVDKIMQAKNTAAPKLNAALAADQTKLSGIGQLQSALASFQDIAKSLSGDGLNLSASSSNASVLSAITTGSSVAGSYTVQVNQLAQGQVLQSQSAPSENATMSIGVSSKISFEFGSTTANTFTPNSTSNATKTVTIPSGAYTLTDIAAAINSANIGVSAKVVASGTGYALQLGSPTGTANSMRISVAGDAAMQNLLNYNPAGVKNLSQTAASQDAMFTINGVSYNSSSNTATSAVTGATLNLTAKGSSQLDIATGTAQITQNVTNLVNAFNALNDKLNALKLGSLKSDGSAARIQNQLQGILTSSNLSTQTLASLGVSIQANGNLSIDANALQSAISADSSGVAKLFTNGSSGLTESLSSQIQTILSPSSELSKKTTSINQDITTLNTKKDALEKSLTAQTNALVQYYSGQSASGGDSSSQGSYSLFDYF